MEKSFVEFIEQKEREIQEKIEKEANSLSKNEEIEIDEF